MDLQGNHKSQSISPLQRLWGGDSSLYLSLGLLIPHGSRQFLKGEMETFCPDMRSCKMCLERWQRAQASLAQSQDRVTTGKHLPRCWIRGPRFTTTPQLCRGAVPMPWHMSQGKLKGDITSPG